MSGLTDVLGNLIGGLAGKWDWLNRKLTAIAIDRIVKKVRSRPHPWSTLNDYISWSGLTDRTFSARLLPARTIPNLPPVEEVGKLFVARTVPQTPCEKSTCLFPAFAQYLTDGFIRTLMTNDPPFGSGVEDRRRTTTNHEIDLSPLYGRSPQQTTALRLGFGGKLKSQMIGAEEFPLPLFLPDGETLNPLFCDAAGQSLLDLPLGVNHAAKEARKTLFAVGGDRANASTYVSMMNILFLREHNRLAAAIARGNPGWDDERLFEVTRNNMIVLFIKIVIEEYINHISGAPFRLRADPQVAWSAGWNRPNWITAEFSLLYRWHSLIPETFKWGGQPLPGIAMILNNGPLLRDGLATAFAEISANSATGLGLFNTAPSLIALDLEVKSLKQARKNNIATYNDYRVAVGGKPARTFEDVTSDTFVQGELKRVYGTPDRIEFYVGLFAEKRGKNGPLPSLINDLVAVDAFSQALTNPLLSEHIWGDNANRLQAFTQVGLDNYQSTGTLEDILKRNSTGLNGRFVGMTRQGWKRT